MKNKQIFWQSHRTGEAIIIVRESLGSEEKSGWDPRKEGGTEIAPVLSDFTPKTHAQFFNFAGKRLRS